MGNFLHRLGVYCYEKKIWVILIWVVILAASGVTAANFFKAPGTSISIPGTEAQASLDALSRLFPDSGRGTARIAIESPAGKTIPDYQAEVATAITKLDKIEGVESAISPFVNPNALSEDKTIAYIQVQLKNGSGSVDDATVEEVTEVVEQIRTDGLTAEVGGDIVDNTPGEILGVGEVAGVALALVVLFITLGSLIAAGMPILVAMLAVGVSTAGLFSLSHVIDINATTPVMGIMLGLAVGIDYSLFIISKYKHYLKQGYKYKDAAGRAVGTAGNAVIFAASTVVIALSALVVADIPFMTTMGLAGASTVALVAIVAVTFLPALLGLWGDKIFGRKMRALIADAQKKGIHDTTDAKKRKNFWFSWGRIITRRPIIVVALTVIAVAVLAIPIKDLNLGLPTDQYAAEDSTERKAYEMLTKGFGDGFNAPLTVVVEGLPEVTNATRTMVRQQILASVDATQMQQLPAVQQQALMAQLEAQVEQYSKLYELNTVAEEIAKRDNVVSALPAITTDDGKNGVIQVIPDGGPSDQVTVDLIKDLRDPATQGALVGIEDVTIGVTGSAALQIDINERLSNALPVYLGVVVGLSFVLLLIAFRSILVPLKATLGFLLSVGAMFGAMIAVFQWGWFDIAEAPGPLMTFIPIIAIGILFGLAMDYEFFLVSSMREAYVHSKDKDAKKAVVEGFGLGAKVVTAAGLIMVFVFAGFIFSHDATIKAMGLGLAVGILVDAFFVRMTIVPAVMTLLGRAAWWMPKWLQKIVPHVSIEGEAIEPAKSRKSR